MPCENRAVWLFLTRFYLQMHGPFLNLLTAIAVAILMATSAGAQSEKKEIAPEDTTELQVKAMIDKLASPGFPDRQQATKDLLNVGPEFVVLLEAAAASSTGETQSRLRMILPQLRKRLFDDQLEAFQAEPSIEIARRLPQWERFEKICGHDNDALSVFRQLLAAEPRLFATRLFASRDLPALLEIRSAELAKECNGLLADEFPVAAVAAVMLLGSEPETRLIRATSTDISSVLDDPRFSELITDGVHAKMLRAIAEAWITRSGIAAERPLLFSMRHDLKAGRTVALRIIESKSNRPDMILSLLCLGKLKSTEDLPLIETLFYNETTLWPQRGQVVRERVPGEPPVDTNYKVQTRDVALVVAAHLQGMVPNEIGFKSRSSDVTLFAHDSIGFRTDEGRSNALAAYRRLTAE
jgi:hypothetical protein